MDNDQFLDDFPIKTSIYSGFSMAMLNNQRVNHLKSCQQLSSAPFPPWLAAPWTSVAPSSGDRGSSGTRPGTWDFMKIPGILPRYMYMYMYYHGGNWYFVVENLVGVVRISCWDGYHGGITVGILFVLMLGTSS